MAWFYQFPNMPAGDPRQKKTFLPGVTTTAFGQAPVSPPPGFDETGQRITAIREMEMIDPSFLDVAHELMEPGDSGGPTNGQVLPTFHVPIAEPEETVIILDGMSPGDDIRDFEGATPIGGGVGGLPVGITIAAARALLRAAMGGATRITRAHWNRLPGWAQSLLAGVGLGVGIDLAMDIPGVPGESILLPGSGGGGADPHFGQHLTDGHLGVTIIGSWEANGVTFYRLSDGKLAVQNKKGRWKVWKPKKPIVLMPGGAVNLKTMLRADALLNRQAKKIASMLNRRAPRTRKGSTPAPKGAVIIQADGKVVNT